MVIIVIMVIVMIIAVIVVIIAVINKLIIRIIFNRVWIVGVLVPDSFNVLKSTQNRWIKSNFFRDTAITSYVSS